MGPMLPKFSNSLYASEDFFNECQVQLSSASFSKTIGTYLKSGKIKGFDRQDNTIE